MTEWEDIDVIQHEIAVRLGIFEPGSAMRDHKAVYWSKNPLGDALAAVVDALVSGGVLERHPGDDTALRWVGPRSGEDGA